MFRRNNSPFILQREMYQLQLKVLKLDTKSIFTFKIDLSFYFKYQIQNIFIECTAVYLKFVVYHPYKLEDTKCV